MSARAVTWVLVLDGFKFLEENTRPPAHVSGPRSQFELLDLTATSFQPKTTELIKACGA